MSSKKQFYPKLLALATIVIIIGALSLVFSVFRPGTSAGEKTITIHVIYEDQSQETYTATTTGEYLEDALEAAEGLTVSGSTTEEFGLMILTVNGVEADFNKNQAYWAVYQGDAPASYGVSAQPVQDSETYSLIYTPAS